jgi:uracil-DNA glycosylase
LNTCLTVQAHKANSHSKKGWEEFTDQVLKAIDARPGPGVVFLAWGLPAQKRMAGVDKQKHLILSSPHPSPLSARTGFHGNSHFKKANAWLREKYGDQAGIDWCKLDPEEPQPGAPTS